MDCQLADESHLWDVDRFQDEPSEAVRNKKEGCQQAAFFFEGRNSSDLDVAVVGIPGAMKSCLAISELSDRAISALSFRRWSFS